MRWLKGLLGLALVAACAEKPAPPPVAALPIDPECRTVVIFSKYSIAKPDKTLPDGWKQFSGIWGKAGWDNSTWCHDLYVTKIEKDGKVFLIDAHGPGGKHDGSAFQRVGKLHPDNHLRFVADGIPREYWIEDGKLKGVRQLSVSHKSEITMNRKS